MGVFDKSFCDCCVCPMQCVLEQLVGVEFLFASILTPTSNQGVTINDVNDFIVFTSQGDYPICNVVAVQVVSFPGPEPSIKLKSIKKKCGRM
ncbi:hypothetical protein [Chengkuizengella sediminis]|uniref:hypothetical protein n=1 Tax=Chengkuizengella sediminis TaxID=1885917 RepID=UPI001389E901|nr:hypothetical protein [Chengkuizengella sediminis]NDI33592.1 hypothetical protein [Chengkuizengella sediminis]